MFPLVRPIFLSEIRCKILQLRLRCSLFSAMLEIVGRNMMNYARSRNSNRENAKPSKFHPVADYSDVVTDEHFERIKELVPETEYHDAEILSGPAW